MVFYSIGDINIEKSARKALNKLIREHNNLVRKGKSNESDKIRPSIVNMVKLYDLNVSGCGSIYTP